VFPPAFWVDGRLLVPSPALLEVVAGVRDAVIALLEVATGLMAAVTALWLVGQGVLGGSTVPSAHVWTHWDEALAPEPAHEDTGAGTAKLVEEATVEIVPLSPGHTPPWGTVCPVDTQVITPFEHD
jgi:hypothetical protein